MHRAEEDELEERIPRQLPRRQRQMIKHIHNTRRLYGDDAAQFEIEEYWRQYGPDDVFPNPDRMY